MRRMVHSALGIWFLIVMTMAQGCAGPAQSNSAYSARDSNASSQNQSQFANAHKPQAGLNTKNFVPDTGASSALTDHLKQHRLPLVGAQVLRNPNDGSRAVVLYGFVGSDLGKSDAQRRAEDFINDPSVEVDNRIRVNPDLLSARGSSSTTPPDASYDPDAQANANASSMPGVQSYVDQQNQSAQVQQYQQQNSMGSSMSAMLPLIALMGLLSMSSGGGSFSTGPPMGYSPYGYPSSPFGGSPYSPYSGYAPGMPPSSFGTPGYGYGSPGGVTPFGSLPGSPYSAAP
jgi:hypothetical protein